MDNFDLRKYLAEGRLFEEVRTPRYPEGKLSIEDKVKAIAPLWKQYQSASGKEANKIKDKVSLYTAYDDEYGGGSYVWSILDDAQSIEDIAKIVTKNEKGYTTSEDEYSVKLLVPTIYYNVENGELSDNKFEWYTDGELKAGADQTSYTSGEELDDVVFSNDYDQALNFSKRYPNLVKVVD